MIHMYDEHDDVNGKVIVEAQNELLRQSVYEEKIKQKTVDEKIRKYRQQDSCFCITTHTPYNHHQPHHGKCTRCQRITNPQEYKKYNKIDMATDYFTLIRWQKGNKEVPLS